MSDLSIVLGNKNYSSWSLRPWLVLKHLGLSFEETVVPLMEDGFKEELLRHSGSGKVPVLKVDGLEIWDSLAICEYLNDCYPEANLWPVEKRARQIARSVACEMHSGFFEIRNTMPMNMRRTVDGFEPTSLCQAEIERILEIWTTCRAEFGAGGPFLFGGFSIADAMFAPVASRFKTYRIALDPVSAAYMETIMNMDAVKEWGEAAKAEPWFLEVAEI